MSSAKQWWFCHDYYPSWIQNDTEITNELPYQTIVHESRVVCARPVEQIPKEDILCYVLDAAAYDLTSLAVARSIGLTRLTNEFLAQMGYLDKYFFYTELGRDLFDIVANFASITEDIFVEILQHIQDNKVDLSRDQYWTYIKDQFGLVHREQE